METASWEDWYISDEGEIKAERRSLIEKPLSLINTTSPEQIAIIEAQGWVIDSKS